jgi:hypothetical protein
MRMMIEDQLMLSHLLSEISAGMLASRDSLRGCPYVVRPISFSEVALLCSR